MTTDMMTMEGGKRHRRSNSAKKHHEKAVGSRAEVWHGTAKHTSGGLTKKHLMKNKYGRIVSRKMHNTAKKTYKKRFGDKMAEPYGKKGKTARKTRRR